MINHTYFFCVVLLHISLGYYFYWDWEIKKLGEKVKCLLYLSLCFHCAQMAEHDEKNILALVESSEQGDYDNAKPFSALGGLHYEIPADDVMNNVVSPLVSFLSHGFPYKFTKHFVLFSAPIFRSRLGKCQYILVW